MIDVVSAGGGGVEAKEVVDEVDAGGEAWEVKEDVDEVGGGGGVEVAVREDIDEDGVDVVGVVGGEGGGERGLL
ncbi:hypothetical protein AGMMS49531_09680 [Endomicrobiia bacterium]|nr:hypothetical protein AGMMS49531_09680 [Endomicrobiia bacterium]